MLVQQTLNTQGVAISGCGYKDKCTVDVKPEKAVTATAMDISGAL